VRGAAIGKAIRKYGRENFTIRIIQRIDDHEDALRLEKYFILKYRSYLRKYGYNRNMGGTGVLWHTEATRAKMSKSHTGKTHTEEFKVYMSQVIREYRRTSIRLGDVS
jgi:hypothetical protein